ncbi:MAG: energy transducer TonB [Phycisphaeraceae bacterium]
MKLLKAILGRIFGVIGAFALTLLLFLVLPLMQVIGEKEQDEYEVQEVNIQLQEAPPDVEDEEEDPPEDPEDPPEEPEIDIDEPQMVDIRQLDLLGGEGGISIPGVDTTINIDDAIGGGDDLDNMFDAGSLDQPARVLFQAQPKLTGTLRTKLRSAAATVIVVFIVDAGGRVQNAAVQSSTDSAFNNAALSAVKQWRFEPAQRKGKPVSDRLRVPINFPKQE